MTYLVLNNWALDIPVIYTAGLYVNQSLGNKDHKLYKSSQNKHMLSTNHTNA